MNENDLFNFQLEYTFTADWLADSCPVHQRTRIPGQPLP